MPFPSERVFQPLNVNPVLEIFPAVAKVTTTVPFAVTESTFGEPVPPFTSKRINEFH